MNRYRFLVAGVVATLGPLGFVTAAMLHAQTQEPQITRGAVIAAQGTAAGAPPCAQCHAFNGVSDASGAFPRLAGQSASYLAQQLRDFASGVRTSALMTPIAKALSPEDIAAAAAYYAGIDAPFLPLKSADAALVSRGEQLAKIGSAERQIQACDNCHGPEGAGEPPAIPYLAGQYAHYIAFTLDMWRQGYRKNNPDFMAVIAKKLSDEDIAAVAAYYQQVQSPLETAESQSAGPAETESSEPAKSQSEETE
jgi:cytochrome c553